MSERDRGNNNVAVALAVVALLVIIALVGFSLGFDQGRVFCQPNEAVASGQSIQNQKCDPRQESIWYDSIAQWVAALTGIVIVAFTFWTVKLVKATITVDRSALDEAKKQTVAAESALRDARAGDRPWLDFKIIYGYGETSALASPVRVKNFGRSPAVRVYIVRTYYISKKIFITKSAYREIVEQHSAKPKNASGICFPNDTSDAIEGWMSAKPITDGGDMGVDNWYLLVCLFYQSASGDLYFTGKTYKAVPPNDFYKVQSVFISTSPDGPDADAEGFWRSYNETYS